MATRWQTFWRSWSWFRGARVAALSAAAGLVALSPLGGGFEEDYGLRPLFRVRGPSAAPSEVIVVAIDRASADRLGLPVPPRRWLRTFHADLIEALEKAAKAIVFYLLFAEEGGAVEDEDLATAMHNGDRVALLQGLERRNLLPEQGAGETSRKDSFDATVDPIQAFGDAAVAIASFPLPTDSARVTSFWAFLSGTDLPTLPSVALQLSASDLADDWSRILAAENIVPREPQAWTDRRLVDAMTEMRRQLKASPGAEIRLRQAIGRLEPDKARRLFALLSLYTGADSRLLNFFGPAGTVRTIPYASIIDGSTADAQISGKIVLVGLSERASVSNVDSYETVYSDANGIDLSGVEILATGLANLMDESSLRTSGAANILIVIAIALVLGLAAASASDLVLGAVSAVLLIAVPTLGYYLFVVSNFVVPVFTPLAIQLPIGILTIGLSLKTAERRARRAIERAAHQFLPSDIAGVLVHGPLSPSDMPASKLVSAIFLATDVKGFATLAERHSPETLDELAKDYFGSLFEATVRHGGEVLNMTGDSMMCAWEIGHDPLRARRNAIAAALDMAARVEEFGARHPSSPMPTRFGLRAGKAAVGVIGGSGHFVAAVVGDVTNTVSRIDSLNKLLNTTMLASAEVLSNIDGLIARPLGTFTPVGKLESVDLIEILARRGENPQLSGLVESFAAGLAAFDAECWSDAANCFRALQVEYPDDGPTSYFLDLADTYSRTPPPPGTTRPIRVNVK